MAKVVISQNSSWSLINFRGNLIKALISEGHDVIAVAPRDLYSSQLSKLGCEFVPIAIDNKGINPLRDIFVFFQYIKIFINVKPDAFLGFTIKPNIYGSLASRTLAIPFINNISGLGTVFIRRSWITKLVIRLYRFALSRATKVFFQNTDDANLFLSEKIVQSGQIDVLPGSGVDLQKFSPHPLPCGPVFRFLFVGRILRDKGVVEFVEAARILKKRGIPAEFAMLGKLAADNRTAISGNQLMEWVNEGLITYLGESDTVENEIKKSDCVVLPSYREGVPRSLLEAAAMARPLVATNVPGCREIVIDRVNGFLCRPQDPNNLAEKLFEMFELSQKVRIQMGQKSRDIASNRFNETLVIEKYLRQLNEI